MSQTSRESGNDDAFKFALITVAGLGLVLLRYRLAATHDDPNSYRPHFHANTHTHMPMQSRPNYNSNAEITGSGTNILSGPAPHFKANGNFNSNVNRNINGDQPTHTPRPIIIQIGVRMWHQFRVITAGGLAPGRYRAQEACHGAKQRQPECVDAHTGIPRVVRVPVLMIRIYVRVCAGVKLCVRVFMEICVRVFMAVYVRAVRVYATVRLALRVRCYDRAKKAYVGQWIVKVRVCVREPEGW
ncbi:hypothetical protein CVT24_006610 [Panaeolus cyanescens]|uniref:Uncharacterized protein n=1 Tax=Panaeolus cyanescens TaxID=181874 RepID=A0A409YS81_9AGAR|nr:hypothetical protein CVT24_006610 [Panaeolus cyanescens]